MTGSRRNRKRASRLPYGIALTLLGIVIGMAWFARGRIRLVSSGVVAPDFIATDLEGKQVALSDYRGRVVLVNVWATWCPPCRKEMPSLENLHQAVRAMPGGEDFVILAVSEDVAGAAVPGKNGRSELEQFKQELKLTFPIVHDPSSKVMDLFQVAALPESFIINRDGVIFLKRAGEQVWDSPQFVDAIGRLLAAKSDKSD